MVRQQTNREENKAIALRFRQDGWGTQPNWEKIWDELISENVVYHFNDQPEPIVGLTENKVFNATLFKGFPNIASTLQDIVAENNSVVYRTQLKGTHTGKFMGIPPTGKSIAVEDFTLVKICDRKIIEWWYTCNLLSVIQQLGIDV